MNEKIAKKNREKESVRKRDRDMEKDMWKERKEGGKRERR